MKEKLLSTSDVRLIRDGAIFILEKLALYLEKKTK